MLITAQKYPLLFQVHDSLSITERLEGFQVDDELFLAFRDEADRTMKSLPAYLHDFRTNEKKSLATPVQIEKAKEASDGLILIEGTEYYISSPERDMWAIYNAHMHPGMRQDVEIPEITEKKSAPHSTAGLPKVLDAAMHLMDSIREASGDISSAIASDKNVNLSLNKIPRIELSQELNGHLQIKVTHEIPALEKIAEALKPRKSAYRTALMVVAWGILLALLLLLFGVRAHAQTTYVRGVANGTTPATSVTVTPNCVANHNCLDVNIASGGGSGGTSSSFGSAFPSTGTAIGVKNGANMVNLAADGSSNLLINCAVGCGGSSFLDEGTFTEGTTPVSIAGCYFKNTPANLSSGQGGAPLCTNDRKLLVQAFQGTSPWVVSNGGTFAVQVSSALPAGTNVIGHVITDTGSTVSVSNFPATQPVSGTVAVTQSTSPWVVGQSTAANLNATVVGTGTFSVQAAQSGTWNIGTLTTITNPVAVTGTFFQVTQPVSCTAANCAENVAQFGGSNVVTGTGTGGSGIPRVTISNDSSLAANQSVNMSQIGGTAVVADPCQALAKVYTPINQAAAGPTTLVAGTSAKKTYICSMLIVTATAQNVNLVEGTGSNCSSVTSGVLGGTTAATGPNLAANGGFAHGEGNAAVAATATNADNLCIIVSGSGQVSGHITTVSQ